MKVVIDAVGIRGHGAASVLLELLFHLPLVRPNWQWEVMLLPRPQRLYDDPPSPPGMTLHSVPGGGKFWQRRSWLDKRLPEQLNRLGGDVLLSLANLVPSPAPVPTVAVVHQTLPFFPQSIGRWAWGTRLRVAILKREIMRRAAGAQRVLVQTETMKRALAEAAGSLRGKLAVVPSGVRVARGEVAVSPQMQHLAAGEGPHLLYLSHSGEHKNHIALVRALPLIRETFPSTKLWLTMDPKGTGDRRSNRFASQILSVARQLKVEGSITWLGVLNVAEVQLAMKQADMLVFPSLAESFGLPLAEAIDAGLPVAAADRPYARDVCGDAAVYFDPLQPGHLAQVVVDTLANAGQLKALATARETVRLRYRYSTIAEQIAAALEQAAIDGRSI